MSYQVRNAYRAARKGNFECDNVAWNGKERDECFQTDASQKFSTLEVWQRFCEVNGIECEYANEYGEPGYGPAEKGILFCNWNRIPKKLADRLEAQGYECEWSDEWYIATECSPCKAYRTSPDCHSWQARVRACDGYMLTPDDDAQEWIDDALNEDGRPLPSWFDESELELRGFKVIDQDDKQVGFHPGQNDTPGKFMPALIKEGYDVVLQITGHGQFDVHYKVWTRKEAKRGVLLDGASGIYIPQRFAREIDRARVRGVSESDYVSLEAGPEHPDYWEVWDEVLRLATLTLEDGTHVGLEQDGDVFYTDSAAEYCEHEDTYYTHRIQLRSVYGVGLTR